MCEFLATIFNSINWNTLGTWAIFGVTAWAAYNVKVLTEYSNLQKERETVIKLFNMQRESIRIALEQPMQYVRSQNLVREALNVSELFGYKEINKSLNDLNGELQAYYQCYNKIFDIGTGARLDNADIMAVKPFHEAKTILENIANSLDPYKAQIGIKNDL